MCVRDDVTSISRVIIMLYAEKGWYFFFNFFFFRVRYLSGACPRIPSALPRLWTPLRRLRVWARACIETYAYTRVNMRYTGCSSSGDGGNNNNNGVRVYAHGKHLNLQRSVITSTVRKTNDESWTYKSRATGLSQCILTRTHTHARACVCVCIGGRRFVFIFFGRPTGIRAYDDLWRLFLSHSQWFCY